MQIRYIPRRSGIRRVVSRAETLVARARPARIRTRKVEVSDRLPAAQPRSFPRSIPNLVSQPVNNNRRDKPGPSNSFWLPLALD
jgi:hypothetical protein